ncbi:uncharacterized protein LOC135101354 isoform X2 [Scylla paramamosain]|uniref:uncharacterized protein LOC135101354 isoform X2 n=1 Tax=Scylla paramamosain TaxID=85552 RepID=UPI0030838F0C
MVPCVAELSGCVSSLVLETFVVKVSEVEAEFHRRISEVQAEFRERISDLQAEFCERISAPVGGSCSTVTLPSKAMEEQWSVVCRGAKRVKVLRAPFVEMKNPFSVLEEVKEMEVDMAGGGRKEVADAVTLSQASPCIEHRRAAPERHEYVSCWMGS